MKRKIFILLFISILLVTGCANKDSRRFKEEYEGINDEVTSYNKDVKYRNITIPEDNPYVYSSAKDILKKIDNKETFYVYFGSPYCPWCRSVVEASIKSSKENGIKKIYYVDIWKGFHEEILRDNYQVEDGKLKKVKDGTDEYYKLLDKFDNLLSDYTITDKDGKEYDVGEKRIYAPNYIYVKNGKPTKLTEGISKKQTKSSMKLDNEIKNDMNNIFNKFFKN